ncbi:hypothetical protein B0T24DRAFT_204420 [Lasiosphaeria ovina]|uniref:Uncharacterized protein n=1 Tax=Lasiosphaeria ovina TaxID=92902 RepID=A0AAE0KG59_9PEZI|nr:hypothetical protein B0T24DRAFT_204420 [Lasiosphaeria ovina]
MIYRARTRWHYFSFPANTCFLGFFQALIPSYGLGFANWCLGRLCSLFWALFPFPHFSSRNLSNYSLYAGADAGADVVSTCRSSTVIFNSIFSSFGKNCSSWMWCLVGFACMVAGPQPFRVRQPMYLPHPIPLISHFYYFLFRQYNSAALYVLNHGATKKQSDSGQGG